MWLSPQRGAKLFEKIANVSRKSIINVPGMVFETSQVYAGATIMLVRRVEVPGTVLRHNSGLSRRNRLTRGVEIPQTMSWYASGSSNGCFPTKQAPLWK
eukprot:2984506-Pyramimonas_sp.AAC.1